MGDGPKPGATGTDDQHHRCCDKKNTPAAAGTARSRVKGAGGGISGISGKPVAIDFEAGLHLEPDRIDASLLLKTNQVSLHPGRIILDAVEHFPAAVATTYPLTEENSLFRGEALFTNIFDDDRIDIE